MKKMIPYYANVNLAIHKNLLHFTSESNEKSEACLRKKEKILAFH